MKSKVTIRDIAYLSGVSISTVSRVVSGKANVNEKTRQKVQDVILQTGYEPNYTARALATKHTNSIAVVIDRSPSQSFANSFFIDVLESIATYLNQRDKDMILVFSDNNNINEDNKVKHLIQSNKIDGVIMLSIHKNDKTLNYLTETGTPTVVIGSPNNKYTLSVDNNNVKSMEAGVNKLIEDGFKKIAFVGGNPDLIVSIDRLKGYKKALKKNKLAYTSYDIYNINFNIDDAYELGKVLIDNGYDAIATTDDLIAYGLDKRFNDENKKIKLLTFNKTLLTELSKNKLTVVDINVKELGKQAVKLLLDEASETNIVVDTKLIEK